MSPVLASSRPILIDSAAAALAMYGIPSGLAAPNVAAPNSAWRRVTSPAGFLTSICSLPLSAMLLRRSLHDAFRRSWPTERDGRLRHHPPTYAKPACSTAARHDRCGARSDWRRLQNLRAELRAAADDFAGDHEHAVTGVVQRLGVFRCRRDMRLHHFEDEEVIAVDQAVIGELAFQVRVAFANQWGRDTLGRIGSQLEMFEFVDRGARGVADPHHLGGQRRRRDVDHSFAAATDQVEAVVAAGDD